MNKRLHREGSPFVLQGTLMSLQIKKNSRLVPNGLSGVAVVPVGATRQLIGSYAPIFSRQLATLLISS